MPEPDRKHSPDRIVWRFEGVVEVFITSKQICTGWNNGKTMIGMQNYNRNQAIMAPGRKISDPAWGTVTMNESWRFVPAAGPHCSVKLNYSTFWKPHFNRWYKSGTEIIHFRLLSRTFAQLPTSQLMWSKSAYEIPGAPELCLWYRHTIRVTKPTSFVVPTVVTNVKCNGNTDGTF